MKCPQCAHENLTTAKFCLECGSRFALTCPKCRSELPPSAKFCLQCGERISAVASDPTHFANPESYTPKHLAERILTSKAALEGERKQVTVLFADLKGSMELLADRDPEDARSVLDPVLQLMMDAVHRYDGISCNPPATASSRCSARRSRTRIIHNVHSMRLCGCRKISVATRLSCVQPATCLSKPA